eukprot:6207234-Pleurochrysis_carterae.AAC.2
MVQATPVEAKAKVRERNDSPPWSADSTCIIPAVTAAVKNTTFVKRETIGQTLLESRAVGFGGTDLRSAGSAVVFGVCLFRGTRGAPIGAGSFAD